MNVFSVLEHNSQLKKEIDRAIDNLKHDPAVGNRIEKRLWPKKYVKKYQINNLFRYQLSGGWRLTYTVTNNEEEGIVVIILNALNHTAYDRLFGYDSS